jgi:predicted site-specific integrase-resolvase
MANGRTTRRYVRKGMTVPDLAGWLGVESEVVYRLIRGGQLAAHRVSPRRLVVTAAEINRFMAATRVGRPDGSMV